MEAKARLVSTVMAPEHWWKSRSRKLSGVDVDVTGRCSHCRRVTCDRRAFPLRRTGGDREARHQQEEETKTYHRRCLTQICCGRQPLAAQFLGHALMRNHTTGVRIGCTPLYFLTDVEIGRA